MACLIAVSLSTDDTNFGMKYFYGKYKVAMHDILLIAIVNSLSFLAYFIFPEKLLEMKSICLNNTHRVQKY